MAVLGIVGHLLDQILEASDCGVRERAQHRRDPFADTRWGETVCPEVPGQFVQKSAGKVATQSSNSARRLSDGVPFGNVS